DVAHRVDEDEPALAPGQRQEQTVVPEVQIETLFIWVTRDAAKPLGEGLRVTVRTARADLRAPRDRIPSRVGPFDPTLEGHALTQWYATSRGKAMRIKLEPGRISAAQAASWAGLKESTPRSWVAQGLITTGGQPGYDLDAVLQLYVFSRLVGVLGFERARKAW